VEIIKINKNKISFKEISLIADFLKRGKTIVYPTDTIYGLGCLATDKKAINKIYAIKKREKKKPFLVLLGDWKMAADYFMVSPEQKKYLKKIWPGKVSVVLRHKNFFPKELSAGLPTLAARLPNNDFLVKIIKAVGVPLVSTSLNLSLRPHLDNVSDLDDYFNIKKPDLIIDSGLLKSKPSKLIDLTDMDNIKILRK
jgi:tRNA threonylcarbamoyl adenosine modification protein (Sua5/YciO/YrdC/YwlC family)